MTRPLLPLFILGLLNPTACAEFRFTALITAGEIEPVAEAVVSLTPVDPVRPLPPPPAEPVVIAQFAQEYQPHVTPLLVGTTVEFPNRDNVQHHLYSLSPPKRFEKPLYDSGTSETVVFDRPGVVTLGCNIHDWMVAHVVVLETPHFALTAEAGTATIEALPTGRYQLSVWHPRLPRPFTREITLAADHHEKIELRLRPDRRLRRAPTTTRAGY